MTLDGKPLDSNRISVDGKGAGVHEVRVRLGVRALTAPESHQRTSTVSTFERSTAGPESVAKRHSIV